MRHVAPRSLAAASARHRGSASPQPWAERRPAAASARLAARSARLCWSGDRCLPGAAVPLPQPGPARAAPSPALSAGTVGGMAALAGAAGVTLAGCASPRAGPAVSSPGSEASPSVTCLRGTRSRRRPHGRHLLPGPFAGRRSHFSGVPTRPLLPSRGVLWARPLTAAGPRARPAGSVRCEPSAQVSLPGPCEPEPGFPKMPPSTCPVIHCLTYSHTYWGRLSARGLRGEQAGPAPRPPGVAATPDPSQRAPRPAQGGRGARALRHPACTAPWHWPRGRGGAGTITQLVVAGAHKRAFTSPTSPGLCPPGARLGRVPLRPTAAPAGSAGASCCPRPRPRPAQPGRQRGPEPALQGGRPAPPAHPVQEHPGPRASARAGGRAWHRDRPSWLQIPSGPLCASSVASVAPTLEVGVSSVPAGLRLSCGPGPSCPGRREGAGGHRPADQGERVGWTVDGSQQGTDTLSSLELSTCERGPRGLTRPFACGCCRPPQPGPGGAWMQPLPHRSPGLPGRTARSGGSSARCRAVPFSDRSLQRTRPSALPRWAALGALLAMKRRGRRDGCGLSD